MADPQPDEKELIERVARGDAEAFEVLVRAHEARLLGFLSRISGDPNIAQEVGQEALVKAFFKAGTFDFRCSFHTWLCEIAIRKFLDWQKQRNRWLRKHALSDLREQFDQPGKRSGPAEEAQSHETAELVRAAIGRQDGERDAFAFGQLANFRKPVRPIGFAADQANQYRPGARQRVFDIGIHRQGMFQVCQIGQPQGGQGSFRPPPTGRKGA